MRPCTCGHDPVAHAHYRPGINCALCGCPSYAARSVTRQTSLALGLAILGGIFWAAAALAILWTIATIWGP